MDILDIDAASFAGRVAHVAAAELYGLLRYGEGRPVANWFDLSGVELTDERIDADVETMTAYVVKRQCVGETLYRFMQAGGDWPAELAERRMAFELFTSTVISVGGRLVAAQKTAEAALELATRPAAKAVDIEDTIFEKEESLHTVRPEAMASQEQIANYQALAKADRKAKRAAKAAADAALERDALAAATRGRPPPLSIGEAPAAAPVNRGGRGKKKPS
jgi:hypothetical protein